MIRFMLMTCALYMIPNESRHTLPWIECATTYMGSIGCGDTVQGAVTIDYPELTNYYNVWELSVIGSQDCDITFSFCNDETGAFPARLTIHDTETLLPSGTDKAPFCPDYPNQMGAIYEDVYFNETTCTPYYVRVTGAFITVAGNYSLSVNCSAGCTPCTLDDEEEEEEEEESPSSESVDDAKADFAERELSDNEIFGYMNEDKVEGFDVQDHEEEVTLRFGDKVWESVYGAMIVVAACCGVFCYLLAKTNKQSVRN